MGNEFKVEIPIEAGGKGGSSGNNDSNFKKLTAAVLAGNISTKILAQITEGLMKAIEPLIKILSILFTIIFLPLMPVIKELSKFLAEVAKGLSKFLKGDISFQEMIDEYLAPAWEELVVGLEDWWNNTLLPLLNKTWEGLKTWWEDEGKSIVSAGFLALMGLLVEALWIGVKEIVKFLWSLVWNGVLALGEMFSMLGTWIWEKILEGLEAITDLGVNIWNVIKDGLSFISNLGRLIWDFIEDALGSLGSFLGFANGGRPPVGQASIVGERGPELFVPDNAGTIIPNNKLGGGGALTVQINNPQFNSEADMRKMVNMISKELQKRGNRSSSK